MVGTQMYSKIQKLKHMGYKKQQAARELGVDNKTVGKYWSMTEHEFANMPKFARHPLAFKHKWTWA